MKIFVFCFSIVLLNSLLGKYIDATYTFELKTTKSANEFKLILKINEKRDDVGKFEDYYGEILISEEEFYHNKAILLNFTCPGTGKTKILTLDMVKHNNALVEGSFSTYYYNPRLSVRLPWNKIKYHVDCKFDDNIKPEKQFEMSIHSEENKADPVPEKATLYVNLFDDGKIRYEFELNMDNLQENKYNNNNKKIEIKIKKIRRDKVYHDHLEINDRCYDKKYEIRVYFKCPYETLHYQLTFKKYRQNYRIDSIFSFSNNDFSKKTKRKITIVACPYSSKYEELENLIISDIAQPCLPDSKSSKVLKLKTNIVNLNNFIYNFTLETDTAHNIKMTIEEKKILKENDKDLIKIHEGKLAIRGIDLEKLEDIRVHLIFEDRKDTYYLMFKKNQKKNYEIHKIKSAEDKYVTDGFCKERSIERYNLERDRNFKYLELVESDLAVSFIPFIAELGFYQIIAKMVKDNSSTTETDDIRTSQRMMI